MRCSYPWHQHFVLFVLLSLMPSQSKSSVGCSILFANSPPRRDHSLYKRSWSGETGGIYRNLLQSVLFCSQFPWKIGWQWIAETIWNYQKLDFSLSSDFIRPIHHTDHSMTSDLHEPPPCYLYNIINIGFIIFIFIIIIFQEWFYHHGSTLQKCTVILICFDYIFWLVRFE